MSGFLLPNVNRKVLAINTQTLVKYLNETYKSANVSWTIDHALRYLNVDWLQEKNNMLSVLGLSSFSNYTKEMNKLIRALKKEDNYNKDDRYCYMFLIKRSDVDKIKAFMPKKRPWGFVFTDALDNYNEDFCRTVAHELGHGCFRLTHNFDDFANVPMGTTQNLMDYGAGNELRRYQWNDIHNLRDVKLWGQSEDGNASMDMNMTAEGIKKLLEIVRDENTKKKHYTNMSIYAFSKGKAKEVKLSEEFMLDFIEVEVYGGKQLSANDPIKRDSLLIKSNEIQEEIIEAPEGEEGEFTRIFYQRYDRVVPTVNELEKSDNVAVWLKVRSDQVVGLCQYLRGESVTGVDFPCAICGKELKLTPEKLKKIFKYNPNIVVNAAEYIEYFNYAFKKGKIDTHDAQAKLFAQILAESSGLECEVEGQHSSGLEREWSILSIHQYFKETLGAKRSFYNQDFWDKNEYKNIISSNYYEVVDTINSEIGNYNSKSNKTIMAEYRGESQSKYKLTFPINFVKVDSGHYKRFVILDKQRNRQNMFNHAYNNSTLGNRPPNKDNPELGDGWRYRGRGAIQLTGRATFSAVQDILRKWGINVDILNNPESVSENKRTSIYSVVAFILWKYGGDLNKFKNDSIEIVSEKVNGGINGIGHRKKEYKRLIKKGSILECK